MKKKVAPDTPIVKNWATSTAVDGQMSINHTDNCGCKWPVVLDSPAKFCGLPVDGKSPYCAGHARIGHNLKR